MEKSEKGYVSSCAKGSGSEVSSRESKQRESYVPASSFGFDKYLTLTFRDFSGRANQRRRSLNRMRGWAVAAGLTALAAILCRLLHQTVVTNCFSRVEYSLDSTLDGKPWPSARQYTSIPTADYSTMTLDRFERDFVRLGIPVLLKDHGLGKNWR